MPYIVQEEQAFKCECRPCVSAHDDECAEPNAGVEYPLTVFTGALSYYLFVRQIGKCVASVLSLTYETCF